MSLPPDIHDIIRGLSEDYRKQLPEKLAQIEALWNEVQAEAILNQEKVQAMHRMVHSLTGSGATFGLAGLSTTARVLESSLKALGQQQEKPPGDQLQPVIAQWQAVKEAAGQTSGAEAPQLVSTPHTDYLLQHRVRDGRSIILIEDDPLQAHSLKMQLGHFGYAVHVLHDVSKLKASIAEISPAALVIDVTYPEGALAGPMAYAALADEVRKGLPAIFISSRGDIEARLEAVRVGGVAYLTKPVDIGVLVDKLDEALSEQESEPYRVLIVDDSVELATFFAYVLQDAGMETRTVSDPFQILEALSEFNPELILLDMYMPGCSGPELAQVIRQQEVYVSTPIVFLSAETDVDKQLAAMTVGADDFLTKPIEPEHLVASVTARVARSRILRSFMMKDSLTGLYNHTKIKERLDFELARAERQKRPLVFAMIDIDNFKRVNDTYGHPAGDRVIKSLSRMLQQRLHKTDIVGRYGGEEFAVILTDTDIDIAFDVMDEIRQGFEKILHQGENEDFSVTFSCGLALYPTFGSAVELGNAADKALYEAKRSGRNRVVVEKC